MVDGTRTNNILRTRLPTEYQSFRGMWIRDSDVKGAFMGRGEDWLSSNDEIYSFGGKIEAPVWG